MECKKSNLLECCLFFTANSLSRIITRMGEEEFSEIGMAPSYAFLLSLAIENPGITQRELAEALNMAPSTVSRFIDTLVRRGLLVKKGQGRMTLIHPTEQGTAMKPKINDAWKALYDRYSKVLGKEAGEELTKMCLQASNKLQQE